VPARIAPRRRRSWVSIASWLAAAILFTIGLAFERHGVWWILAALALAPSLIVLSWRRKAAKVPGATFASSADLCPDGPDGARLPGELSVTASGLTWMPGPPAIRKGLAPVSLPNAECDSVSMQAGPALLDVVITVRGRSGDEWCFLTHRSPGLSQALSRLDGSPSE